ncbi:MAG TPA: hypothetical protein VF807_13435 [Ktedonobacterales bacterium]
MKQWYLIALGIVFGIAGAALGSFFLLTPMYTSTATLRVVNGPDPAITTSAVSADRVIQTQIQLASTEPVLTQVAAQFPGLTPEALRREITVTAESNTNLFQVAVRDASPARAADIANAIATEMIADQQQVSAAYSQVGQDSVQLLITQTQNQIDSDTAKLNGLAPTSANAATSRELRAHIDALQAHLLRLEATLSQILASNADALIQLRVSEAAQPSSKPSQPVLPLNIAVGAGVGLVLGLLIAIMLEMLDQRVPTSSALAKLTSWPVLAGVASTASPSGVAGLQQDAENNRSAYRTLSTNLEFLGVERQIRSVAVASATQNDDSGPIAAQLALALARGGKRVILVDANWAQPSQAQRFGVTATRGLSDAVLAFKSPGTMGSAVEHYIFPSTVVDAPSLRIMPTGSPPPNASHILRSQAMKSLAQGLVAFGADLIVFDAPAILGSSDPRGLWGVSDGVLVVADLRQRERSKLLRAKARLADASATVLGSIAIGAPRDHSRLSLGAVSHDESQARENHRIDPWTYEREVERAKAISPES